jgi:hypothetical protein
MPGPLSRRGFLAGAVASPWLLDQATGAERESKKQRSSGGPTLDLHVHLFGLGDSGSGCRIARKITEGRLFKSMAPKLLRQAKTLDEGYVLALASQLKGSGLDKALILAQDAVYDRNGKPDWEKTPFYIPNDYLFAVVRRYSQWMIPCVSINPDRADAIAELDRCFDEGARVLKIHPPIQGVDLADKRHTRFFERCATLKVVVMVHTGHEHSAPILDVGLANPRRLARALDAGCTVVACHCGTGWLLYDEPDMVPDFLAMIQKYPNLWGDTSVLGSALRVADFARLLVENNAVERLLHGSDFPFPCHPLAFSPIISLPSAIRVQGVRNRLAQDLALKEALGVGMASARRAYHLVHGCP